MKKTLVLVLSLLTVAGLFVGCQGGGAAAAVVPFDANKAYTISVGCYGDLEAAYTTAFATEEFRRLYPNLTFTYQTADFGGHHNRLTTVIAAGEATNDIEALEVGYIAQFVAQASLGLTDLNASPFNAGQLTPNLVQFAVSNATTVDGALVAMPVDIAPAVLFYREELCAAAGVTSEEMRNLTSWEDYVRVGMRLTNAAEQRWAIPNPADVALIPLNGGKGGWFDYSQDNWMEHPLEPRDRFINVLRLVQGIRAASIDANYSDWSDPWAQSFANGQILTMVNGAWFGGALRTYIAPATTDWRVAYLPGHSYASLGGSYLSIPAVVSNEQKAAAWEVIKFLTNNPVAQLSTFARIDAFPALTTVYNDPIMSEPIPYFGNQADARQIMVDVALHIPANQVSAYDAAILGIWNNAVTAVINNEMTIDEAYESALTQVNGIIQ